MKKGLMFSMIVLAALAGCDKGDDSGTSGRPIPAFGSGTVGSVQLDVVAVREDGLDTPRDLQFNPNVEGELWVVSRSYDSMTIFQDVGGDNQTSSFIIDPAANHFMEEVSSLAFGAATFAPTDALSFATCQESRNTYNDQAIANDFMGPALWTSDLDLFGESNPEAIKYLTEILGFYADLGSHLDMLHESPLCMGIAWETENVYWVFDGADGTLVRYDFQEDHGIGYDDHSDGLIYRYVDAEVARVEDVPSHMVIDHETNLLYTVDTGNNRITVLDITTGEEGDRLTAIEPGTTYMAYTGGDYSTLVDGNTIDGMELPSGIALVEDTLLVTDNKTSHIFAFDLEGNFLDEIDLELSAGALMGIEARSLEDIWLTDAVKNQLLHLQPSE